MNDLQVVGSKNTKNNPLHSPAALLPFAHGAVTPALRITDACTPPFAARFIVFRLTRPLDAAVLTRQSLRCTFPWVEWPTLLMGDVDGARP